MTNNLDNNFITELTNSNKRKINIENILRNFLENKQYDEAKRLIKNSHIADIADIIESSSDEMKSLIISLMNDDFNPQILIETADNIKLTIFKIMGEEKFISALNLLSINEIIDVILGLNEKTQNKIINKLDEEKQKILREILSYREDSVGRIMNKNTVSIPSYWLVKTAIEYLQQKKSLPKDFYEIFIVDPKHRPIGSLLVSRLFRCDNEKLIAEIMNRQIQSIKASDGQEQVAILFKKYNLVSAPVVTDENRLIGQIVIDDIIDIIEKEAEKDILRLSGIGKGKIIFRSQILSNIVRRLPWLFINLVTAFLTSKVISNFEETINKMMVLASLMPIVASLGGNAGTQTLTLSVRAIAHGKISSSNFVKVIGKEILTSIMNGLFIALLGSIIIYYLFHQENLSLIFSLAVISNFAIAGFLGSFLPIGLKKMGFDPALGSGVFLTACTDIVGFFAFLAIASLIYK